jgi:hypothetical protein
MEVDARFITKGPLRVNQQKPSIRPPTLLQCVDPGEAVPAAQLQHRGRRGDGAVVGRLAHEPHEVDARLPDFQPACV